MIDLLKEKKVFKKKDATQVDLLLQSMGQGEKREISFPPHL